MDHRDKIDLSGMGRFFKRNPRTKSRSHKTKRQTQRRRRHYKHGNKASSQNHGSFTTPQSLGRKHYNDLLVNVLGPREISGLAAHTALRTALHAPERFRESMGKSDMFPIIWDSGASACVTFDRDDFLSFNGTTTHKPLKSISGTHAVRGEGYVLWSIPDETGVLRHLKLKALWVPDCHVRLLSTEGLLQTYKEEKIELKQGILRLSGSTSDQGRNPITVRNQNPSIDQSPNFHCLSLQWM